MAYLPTPHTDFGYNEKRRESGLSLCRMGCLLRIADRTNVPRHSSLPTHQCPPLSCPGQACLPACSTIPNRYPAAPGSRCRYAAGRTLLRVRSMFGQRGTTNRQGPRAVHVSWTGSCYIHTYMQAWSVMPQRFGRARLESGERGAGAAGGWMGFHPWTSRPIPGVPGKQYMASSGGGEVASQYRQWHVAFYPT